MSSLALIRSHRPSIAAGICVTAMALLLVACGGDAGVSSAPAESSGASSVASVSPQPSEAAEPTASTGPSESPVALCLPADIFGALEDISNVVEPSVPAEDIADAVEALDLSSFNDEPLVGMQADLVSRLRDGDTHSFDLQVAAGFLLQRANLSEC